MGVALVAMGSYIAIMSLKCFVPTKVSKFYHGDSPQAKAAMKTLGGGHGNHPSGGGSTGGHQDLPTLLQ